MVNSSRQRNFLVITGKFTQGLYPCDWQECNSCQNYFVYLRLICYLHNEEFYLFDVT